jgi:ABC-type branched-subunit amino acid transport system substrate-binding protein
LVSHQKGKGGFEKMKGRSPKVIVGVCMILVLTVSALLPACGPAAPEAPETIKIGTVTDQTGPLAAFGVASKWGYEHFKEVVNADGGIYVAEYDKKIPVEILYGDHSADEQKAVTEMEYLAEQGVVALSGTTAIMPLADDC